MPAPNDAVLVTFLAAPLVPMVLALLPGSSLGLRLVAAGMTVAVSGDVVSWFGGGSFLPSYVWLPAQFALLVAGCLEHESPALVGLAMFVGLVGLSVVSAGSAAPGPDLLVTVSGSTAALMAARDGLRFPVWLYAGLGTAAYVVFAGYVGVAADGSTYPLPGWEAPWWAYQTARMLALLSLALLIIHERRDLWPT